MSKTYKTVSYQPTGSNFSLKAGLQYNFTQNSEIQDGLLLMNKKDIDSAGLSAIFKKNGAPINKKRGLPIETAVQAGLLVAGLLYSLTFDSKDLLNAAADKKADMATRDLDHYSGCGDYEGDDEGQRIDISDTLAYECAEYASPFDTGLLSMLAETMVPVALFNYHGDYLRMVKMKVNCLILN